MLGQTKIIILRLCPTVKSLKMRAKYASILMGGAEVFGVSEDSDTNHHVFLLHTVTVSGVMCRVSSYYYCPFHTVHCPTIIIGSSRGLCFELGLD